MLHERTEDRVWELIDEADGLPRGPAQVALGEEAVRLADSSGDIELAFSARRELVNFAYFSGQPQLALVTFSWCLSQCDNDPDLFPEEELLWEYKWIVSALPAFPEISRQQIENALADFQRRYERHGHNLRPVYLMRQRVARMMGNLDDYHRYFRLWQDAPPDENDDCPACRLDQVADYMVLNGQAEAGFEKWGPVLRGEMTCESVPHTTYGRALIPLLQLRRLKEARQYAERGRELIAGRPAQFVHTNGYHMEYLALIGNHAAGLKLFESTVFWAFTAGDPLDHFTWWLGARMLFERMERAGTTTVTLRLPAEHPLRRESGEYAVKELAADAAARVDELVARFDARNGNDYYTRRSAEARDLHKLADELAVEANKKK